MAWFRHASGDRNHAGCRCRCFQKVTARGCTLGHLSLKPLRRWEELGNVYWIAKKILDFSSVVVIRSCLKHVFVGDASILLVILTSRWPAWRFLLVDGDAIELWSRNLSLVGYYHRREWVGHNTGGFFLWVSNAASARDVATWFRQVLELRRANAILFNPIGFYPIWEHFTRRRPTKGWFCN